MLPVSLEKDPNYKFIAKDMLEHLKKLGCNIGLKVYFLRSHLEYFPENLYTGSEEQSESFHQVDIMDIERKCQDRWNVLLGSENSNMKSCKSIVLGFLNFVLFKWKI